MRIGLLACFVIAVFAITGDAFSQIRAQATPMGPTPRQQEVLRQSGVTLPPMPVHMEGVLLTVRAPWANNASLSFRNATDITPSAETQGVAELNANPRRVEVSWVKITFLATPTAHYVIDCMVSGAPNYRYVRWVGTGPQRHRVEMRASVSGARAGVAMPPMGVAGPAEIYLAGGEHAWQLRSCHVQGFG